MSYSPYPPVAKSADRKELLAAVACNSEAHYKMMLDEAAAGRERLSYDPKNLAPTLMAGRKPQTPYKYDQLSETARHREILNIYRLSSPYTRPYYERGHTRKEIRQGEFVEENWAIDWFLWHTFRYRDNRPNRSKGTAGPGRSGSDHGDGPVNTR